MKLTRFLALMTGALLTVGMTSCSDDDNDNDDNDGGNGGNSSSLVSPTIPSAGWSGNSDNGTWTYLADNGYDPEEELVPYLAFDMSDGVAKSGVVNVVCPDASYAKALSDYLRSGQWIEEDEDDDDDYYSYAAMGRRVAARAASAGISRASEASISVSYKGNVIYMAIPNADGLTAQEVRTASYMWSNHIFDMPTRVAFGKYENNIYTCSNLMGIGIDCRIVTEYNADDCCTKYATTYTCPSAFWASALYEEFEASFSGNNQFQETFGRNPDLILDGNRVTIDAIIIGDVQRKPVEDTIILMDYQLNCPVLFSIMG